MKYLVLYRQGSTHQWSFEDAHSPTDAINQHIGSIGSVPLNAECFVQEWPPDPPPAKFDLTLSAVRNQA